MRHRLRPARILSLLIGILVVTAILIAPAMPVPTAGAASFSSDDLAKDIAARYPDRKTSSYDSQRFLSETGAHLTQRGWWTYLQRYSSLIRSGSRAPNTSFTQVSGENLLACPFPPSQAEGIDLLIVAPYDSLTVETGEQEDITYTARAAGALLSLANNLDPSLLNSGRNLAVAFVSGHYQYGAGIGALLDELTVTRGISVKTAVVLGDIDALDSMPLTVADDTPAALIEAIFASAKQSGPVTVVGPRIKSSWYRSVMRPQAGAYLVESMLDGGVFMGEAQILSSRGIPAVTLGTPRNNLKLPLTSAAEVKIPQVTETLLGLIVSPEVALPTGGPPASQYIMVQAFGNLYLVSGRVMQTVAGVAVLLVLVMVAVMAKRMKDLASLALLSGILLAMSAAHPLRSMWFSGDPLKYALVLRPYESLFLLVWSGLGLVTFGFFRIWRIRTRIAHLHSKIPRPVEPSLEPPVQEPASPLSTPDNWVGPWALATMAAVLLGTSLLRSELAGAALVSTLGLLLAVALGYTDKAKPLSRLIRLVGASSVLAVVLWAGNPTIKDVARIYALSVTRFGVESVAFTLSLAVFVACAVSTFHLPPPASKTKMVLVTVAELTILAVFIAVGMTIPRYTAGDRPAKAVVQELLGDECRILISSTRPLGTLTLLPSGTEPSIPGIPSSLSSRSIADTVRPSANKVTATWADVTQSTIWADKGETKTEIVGQVSAVLAERPAYFQLTFQDVALTRNNIQPFRLMNLHEMVGVSEPSAQVDVEPRTGYSITLVWWMPLESLLTREFHVVLLPMSSRLEVTGRAVYLDRSYMALQPSAPNTSFTLLTSISGQVSYR